MFFFNKTIIEKLAARQQKHMFLASQSIKEMI